MATSPVLTAHQIFFSASCYITLLDFRFHSLNRRYYVGNGDPGGPQNRSATHLWFLKFNVAIEATNTFDVDNWSSKKSSIQNLQLVQLNLGKNVRQIYLSIGQIIDQYISPFTVFHIVGSLSQELCLKIGERWKTMEHHSLCLSLDIRTPRMQM